VRAPVCVARPKQGPLSFLHLTTAACSPPSRSQTARHRSQLSLRASCVVPPLHRRSAWPGPRFWVACRARHSPPARG
jgi:hypothetical protein